MEMERLKIAWHAKEGTDSERDLKEQMAGKEFLFSAKVKFTVDVPDTSEGTRVKG